MAVSDTVCPSVTHPSPVNFTSKKSCIYGRPVDGSVLLWLCLIVFGRPLLPNLESLHCEKVLSVGIFDGEGRKVSQRSSV